MKMFLIAALCLASTSVQAGNFHGKDHEQIKKKYGKSLNVKEKQFVQLQVESLVNSMSAAATDPSVVRKRVLDSTYKVADKRHLFMGWLWAIHKEAVYRVAYGRTDQLLLTEPDAIAAHYTDKDSVGDVAKWLWDKYRQTFDYKGNLDKLNDAIYRYQEGVCNGKPDGRQTFTDATEITGGVIGWIGATAGCVPVDPSFGVLTTFVCQPGGFIIGDYIGLKVGEIVFDKKCSASKFGASEINLNEKELQEVIAYR